MVSTNTDGSPRQRAAISLEANITTGSMSKQQPFTTKFDNHDAIQLPSVLQLSLLGED
jgi:hypothetical protein